MIKIHYWTIGMALLCLNGQAALAQETNAGGHDGRGAVMDSMLIDYEAGLENETSALTDVLKIRLGRYGVELSQKAISEKNPPGVVNSWVVTLRRISERHLILTIDSGTDEYSVSEVRTVSYHADLEQLAWTMALVIEETVTPYLESSGELPALGAGLAILEPEEVGGTKRRARVRRSNYPRLYAFGAGLSLGGIWSVDEILMGPRVLLEGIFSKRTVAQFALGWQGSASFAGADITGTMSQIPIELYVGHVFFRQRIVRFVGWAGVSLGFTVYKTQFQDNSRTDMTFQPGGNLLLEFATRIVAPLEVFIQGGCNFPFVRDVLVNNRQEIYSQVWIMPMLIVGLQLAF